MTGIQSLEARSALGVFFAILSYFASTGAWIHRGSRKLFDRAAYIAFALTRFGLYIAVFFILRLPARGDVVGFYVPEARGVLHHLVLYRDIVSSYAPLHPYLDAAILLLWNSPLAIILFSILVEYCLFAIWLRISRHFASEPTVRIAAVLYLASAISLQFVAIDGQNNVLIAILLSLAILVLARHRAVLSGVLVAFSTVLIKFLPLLFVPAFFLSLPRRFRWLAGFTVTLLVGYGYFALRHFEILFPFYLEVADHTASNLLYVVEGVFNVVPPDIVEDAILALALLAVLALFARIVLRRQNTQDTRTAMRLITFGSAALLLTLLIFSKKSWPPYLVLTLFPLCLLMGQGTHLRLRLACFAIFNAVAVTSHSIWATVFGQFLAPAFHQSLAAHRPAAFIFLAAQIALIAGYIWLLAESVAAFRSTDQPRVVAR
jgi:hypothetical protein